MSIYDPSFTAGLGLGALAGAGNPLQQANVAHTNIWQPFPQHGTVAGTNTITSWPPTSASLPTYEPVWSPAEVGRAAVQKIENGYLVLFQRRVGGEAQQYFAADYKEVGERITACLVAAAVQGEQR